MLEDKKLKSFIPTTDPERSKNFYTNILGLKLLSENEYGMEFHTKASLLRINVVKNLTPQPFTVLGWDVDDLTYMIVSLVKAGVEFERYNFIEQDNLGIWLAPGGVKVAWFKDPDGNILSLTEDMNSANGTINHH